MNCIIIDDEPLAIQVIDSYCTESNLVNVIGAFTSAIEALECLRQNKVDLIFCDIEMPQLNGLELINSLEDKPLIIFTTAYTQYALEGFNVNAVDYLVKPVPFPRFIKAVGRAKDIFSLKNEKSYTQSINQTNHSENIEYIFVKSDYESVKINVSDLKYIEGLKDYLKLCTVNEKPVLTLMSFKAILNLLPKDKFIRVHKSFLVNIDFIDSIQKKRLMVVNEKIPIGEFYKEDVYRKLNI